MTTIFHPAHPHYAAHKQFIEGSFADPDEPPVVQYECSSNHWADKESVSWSAELKYRIKPRTITRTVTYPEPLREAPEVCTWVWMVRVECSCPQNMNWAHSKYQLIALKNGIVFATEADAQQCYDALFGEQK